MRKQKKYHFIYKTTNVLNNTYYIGMHSTDNLDDGYLGSGKRIWNSIRKHGKEAHKVEILEFLSNRKLLALKEKEILSDEILKDPFCMNLVGGGEGNFTYESALKGGLKFKERLEKDHEFREQHREKMHLAGKKGYKAQLEKYNGNTFLQVEKRNEAARIFHLNSIFIHEIETGKEKKLEKGLPIPDGWVKGRNKSKIASKNTIWIFNLQTLEKKRIKNDLPIPDGWGKGRKPKEDNEMTQRNATIGPGV